MSRKRKAMKPLASQSEPGDDGSSAEPQPTKPPSSDEEESGSESNGGQKSTTAKLPVAAADADAKIDEQEKKSNLFQRLFTEEDEIVLLKGMLGHAKEKNADPDAFYGIVKKKLHVDFSEPQVRSKLKRLKKKFYDNMGKGKEGREKTFTKPHDHKAFDLCMKVWGDVAGKANGGVAKKKKKVNGYGYGTGSQVKNVASVEHAMLTTGSDLYEAGLGTEGENEWNKLRVEELKLYLKQLEVRAAQTKLVLDIVNH